MNTRRTAIRYVKLGLILTALFLSATATIFSLIFVQTVPSAPINALLSGIAFGVTIWNCGFKVNPGKLRRAIRSVRQAVTVGRLR